MKVRNIRSAFGKKYNIKIKHNNKIYDIKNIKNIDLKTYKGCCEMWFDNEYITSFETQREAMKKLQEIYNNENVIYEV